MVNANLFVAVHELKLRGQHKVSTTVCTRLNLPSLDVKSEKLAPDKPYYPMMMFHIGGYGYAYCPKILSWQQGRKTKQWVNCQLRHPRVCLF